MLTATKAEELARTFFQQLTKRRKTEDNNTSVSLDDLFEKELSDKELFHFYQYKKLRLKRFCGDDRRVYQKKKILLQQCLKIPEDILKRQKKKSELMHYDSLTRRDTHTLKIGSELFQFTTMQLQQAGGLLHAYFLGGMPVKSDQQGVYQHKGTPPITPQQMNRIRQYLTDSLPQRLVTEEVDELLKMNEGWDIHGFDAATHQKRYNHEDAMDEKNHHLEAIKEIRKATASQSTELNLSGLHITHIPEEIFDLLPNLKKSTLRYCRHLTHLPLHIDSLLYLESIDLTHCIKLTSLPENFGKLNKLHSLIMEECQSFKKFPETFCLLSNLEKLDLWHCDNITA